MHHVGPGFSKYGCKFVFTLSLVLSHSQSIVAQGICWPCAQLLPQTHLPLTVCLLAVVLPPLTLIPLFLLPCPLMFTILFTPPRTPQCFCYGGGTYLIVAVTSGAVSGDGLFCHGDRLFC